MDWAVGHCMCTLSYLFHATPIIIITIIIINIIPTITIQLKLMYFIIFV